jgi:hypothetical protein
VLLLAYYMCCFLGACECLRWIFFQGDVYGHPTLRHFASTLPCSFRTERRDLRISNQRRPTYVCLFALAPLRTLTPCSSSLLDVRACKFCIICLERHTRTNISSALSLPSPFPSAQHTHMPAAHSSCHAAAFCSIYPSLRLLTHIHTHIHCFTHIRTTAPLLFIQANNQDVYSYSPVSPPPSACVCAYMGSNRSASGLLDSTDGQGGKPKKA